MNLFTDIVKTLLTSSLFVGILYLAFKKYIDSFIETKFKKKLVSYEHTLSLVTENARFDYQRKIQDFSLYTVKKHERYLELHRLLEVAYSSVSQLYGLRHELTYQEYNEADMLSIMEKEKFPKGKIDEVLASWKTEDKSKAIEIVKQFFRIIEFSKAESAIKEARNYYFLSKMYLSDELEKLTLELLNKLHEVYVGYKMVDEMQGISGVQDRVKISESSEIKKKQVEVLLEKAVKQMKTELSIGYYQSAAT